MSSDAQHSAPISTPAPEHYWLSIINSMRLRNDCIHSLCIGVSKVSERMPEMNICILFGLMVPEGLAHGFLAPCSQAEHQWECGVEGLLQLIQTGIREQGRDRGPAMTLSSMSSVVISSSQAPPSKPSTISSNNTKIWGPRAQHMSPQGTFHIYTISRTLMQGKVW